jgi:hypothetical protein
MDTIKALVIPSEGPLFEVELTPDDDGSSLAQLQALVGGYIQALPIPEFVPGSDHATAYVNEEGKFDPDCPPNMRATDFFVPGIGIFAGDYIAGACANAKAKRPLQVGDYIDVSISPEGWMFMAQTDRLTFEGQAVGDRLEYRRAFEAQVALAKDTPTRGAA